MTVLTILDYLGIVVFAITGALVAARQENDIIGFAMLGTVTGIGGGTIRDVLLNNGPVFWIEEPIYLIICVMTSCVMFFIAHFMDRYRNTILWGDALGMALFAVVGTQIALEAQVSPLVAILMGMITATFGGIIRDVLSMQESLVMRKEIYATACFTGASSYALLTLYTDLNANLCLWTAIVLTFFLRAAAIIFNLRLPGYKWIERT